ncbi:porin family protein [Fibrella sp. WM1]|uniref:porin family protein n=1 Tax=Fibrella musci TaxID=3242485 RepID=UPI003520FA07
MNRTTRILLLASVAGTLFHSQLAQAQSRQRWSFGPRVGLNLTNFVGSDVIVRNPFPNVEANRLTPGLSAGVGFIYSDISRFGFGVDLLYSQRGNELKNSAPGSRDPETIVYRVNYLELPLTARYFLNRSGNFRPNVFVGAVPALRLNARDKASGNGVTYTNDVTSRYRTADLGLTAGFQLNWRTGDRQRFTVDARYTQGVTNIVTNASDVRNQMITVGLGYNFGIGREYQPGDRKLPIRPR